jgi:hypothetical protein
MVITGAGDRSPDRVGKLVYLDAANPKNGQSLVDVTRGGINFVRDAGQMVDGVELVLTRVRVALRSTAWTIRSIRRGQTNV